LLRLNRLQQKRALKNYTHKTQPEQKSYTPKITNKTQAIANRRRNKLVGGRPVDVVEILLHPANVEDKYDRLERVRREQEAKELKELTLHPKTNKMKNQRWVRQPNYSTGDHNVDLYSKSKVHEKRDKTSEEYWFEKEANECYHTPEINKGKKKDEGYVNERQFDRMREAREKQIRRMNQAREEKNFKKKMTERSEFSATQGMGVAREVAKYIPEENSTFNAVHNLDKSKYRRGFAGEDGSQICPPRREFDVTKPRAPLHHPKAVSPVRSKKKTPKRNWQPEMDDEPIYSNDPKDLVDQQLSKIDDKIDERDPKLYVDVNIGKTGTEKHMERITVYEGDTAEQLATEFCQKHNLNEDMKEKLKIMLEQQIAGVLPKIMEDEGADDDEDSDNENQN